MLPLPVREIVKRYTSIRFRRAVYHVSGAAFDGAVRILFCTLGLPALYLLEPIARLRVGELRINHIGHLAIESELLLRQMRLDGAGRATRVFLMHSEPANRQLLDMWRRRLTVIEIRNRLAWRAFSAVKPLLARTGFEQPFPAACSGWGEEGDRCHEVMFREPPQLAFTPDEEARGQAELRRMGVPEGAWFVAFHARDPRYYASLRGYRKKIAREFRDMAIETMFEAMRCVTESGGYVVRMGAVVERALPGLGPRIIDYATFYRTDFMDIYLCAKARFFMGSNSGLACVAQIFDVPVGFSNLFPYHTVPSGKGVTYMRMFLRDRATGAILSFPEIKRRGLLQCPPELAQMPFQEKYCGDRGLDIVHNDAEDVTGLCMDMMDQAEGRAPAPEGVRLRDRYRMLYDGVDREPEAGQLGTRFALRHARLIEPDHLLAEPALDMELSL